MGKKSAETKAATPLSVGELSVYGVKPIIGCSSMGQLHAVYGSSKPGRNRKGGQ